MGPLELRRARLRPLLAAQAGQARPGSGALAISGCRAYLTREPASKREYSILRIETAGGITGWGETRSIIATELAQAAAILRGHQATEFASLQARLSALPNVQAAVNMALLDIVGQASRVPVYQLLGGPTRHKIRALAPLVGVDDTQIVEEMRRAQDAGFRAFLIPVAASTARNSGRTFAAANRDRLKVLRSAGGEQMDFAMDCGGMLTPGDAASLSDAVERQHPLWLDEPCAHTNLAALRKIAAERVTPLAFGRNVTHAGAFQDLVREDLIDVVRPDIGQNGITQIRKFAALAEANYMAVAPHHDGGPIGSAAAIHLAASLPNFFIQQIPFPTAGEDRRFRMDLAGLDIEAVVDGYLKLPTAPGLGIRVNTAMLGQEVA